MTAAAGGRRLSRSRGWCWSAVLAVTGALAPLPAAAAPMTTKTLVVMGDSLVAETVGDLTADLHGAGWHVDATGAVPGAGLLDTHVSWLAKAEALVARDHPAAAVVEYVGNYGVYGALDGVTAYSPRFYALWDRAAQRLEDALAAGGATVYWVIGPPVAPRQNEAGIVVFDKQYPRLHAPDTASGHPPLIDVTPALTGGTGRYRASVPGRGGRSVRVRRADGVHLSSYGDALFAAVVARAVG